MIERMPISRMGFNRLRKELEHLERRERHDVIRAIEVAREHGDLRENAEYHAAKERQGHVEGRILELKDKLSRAEVIDCSEVNCRGLYLALLLPCWIWMRTLKLPINFWVLRSLMSKRGDFTAVTAGKVHFGERDWR